MFWIYLLLINGYIFEIMFYKYPLKTYFPNIYLSGDVWEFIPSDICLGYSVIYLKYSSHCNSITDKANINYPTVPKGHL